LFESKRENKKDIQALKLMSKSIRNFIIISHIDHGKSTLADRLLEITQTVSPEKMQPQFLDSLDLEREKGITIKMRPVRMIYHFQHNQYILNLVDSPGHVDFAYEVSRGLAAVEGAILLVDAIKGIQAQTLHHLVEAQKQGLVIIPVINKIDLSQVDIPKIKKEIQGVLGCTQEILEISAKYGTNVEKLLQKIITEIPAPKIHKQDYLQGLIFDFRYDSYRGVIVFVRIINGQIKKGENIYFLRRKIECQIQEVGYLQPEMFKCKELKQGEIGYFITGIKDPSQVRVGDTVIKLRPNEKIEDIMPLPGYEEPEPKVFIAIYPEDSSNFLKLQKSLQQLRLMDPAFTLTPEKNIILGQGFNCGFLGNLHAEIIITRLKREFNLTLIIFFPQVVYRIVPARPSQTDKIIQTKENFSYIFSAKDFPKNLSNQEIQERWVKLEILLPQKFFGAVFQLLEKTEGCYRDTKFLGNDRLVLIYEVPFREIILEGFYDKLKGISQGFASLYYEMLDWRQGDLKKIEVLIAGEEQEPFAQIVSTDKVFIQGRKIVKKLKAILPKEQFEVAIQARVDGKIIARETISARRKDVAAPLYGGDVTRKMKLWERQKKGKKRLQAIGKVRLSPEMFLQMLKE
jgi:GTP-binding protein LepA